MQQLKRLVKDVVRVVSPSTSASAAAARSAKPARNAPSSRPPQMSPEEIAAILGHVPGVDKVEYNSNPAGLDASENEYSITVDGVRCGVFFLCGHPRSGTHWMDNVIARHPHASMNGEFRFEALRNAYDDMTGKGWHACYHDPMKSEAERCFRESVRRIIASQRALKPSAVWLGDRTPRPFRVLLPGAPHFLILRDPRDVVVSLAHQEIKNAGFNYTAGKFEPELGEQRIAFNDNPDYFNEHPERLLGTSERFTRRLARRWRNHLRLDLEELRRVEQGEVLARVRVIRYERIHADPEGERAAMYRFLGLDPAKAEPLNDESLSKPGISNENPHNIYRKGKVGDWRRFFTPEVWAWFAEETGRLPAALGYEAVS